MTDEEILERLRKHYQTEIDNVNQDTMAEGPFADENETLETYGELWEQAASRIVARGGLRVHFAFAVQQGRC